MIWRGLTRRLRVISKDLQLLTKYQSYLVSCQQASAKFSSSCSRHSNYPKLQSIIPVKADNYEGLHFELSNINCQKLSSVEEFANLVHNEINQKEDNVQTIWFKVLRENIRFVEPLVKLGFEFHHTNNDSLYLVKSLGAVKNIPRYAYTNVGVGGLVVNDQMKVLVVKEKHSPIKPRWKFPGGYAEQGEELSTTAEREVFEETGIKSQFQTLLTVRHMHRFAFDCSDLYFVFLLKPITEQIKICDREIEQCKWESCEQIRTETNPFNRFVIDKYLEWKAGDISIRHETFDPKHKLITKYEIYSMKTKTTSGD